MKMPLQSGDKFTEKTVHVWSEPSLSIFKGVLSDVILSRSFGKTKKLVIEVKAQEIFRNSCVSIDQFFKNISMLFPTLFSLTVKLHCLNANPLSFLCTCINVNEFARMGEI
jgi:hypothetical protein